MSKGRTSALLSQKNTTSALHANIINYFYLKNYLYYNCLSSWKLKKIISCMKEQETRKGEILEVLNLLYRFILPLYVAAET